LSRFFHQKLDKTVKSNYPVGWWFVVQASSADTGAPFVFQCPCGESVSGFKCINGVYSESVNIGNVYSHIEKQHNRPCNWTVVTDLGNTILVKTFIDEAKGDRAAGREPWSLAQFVKRLKESPKLPDTFLIHAFKALRIEAMRQKEEAEEAERAAKRRRVGQQTTLPQTLSNLAATAKREQLQTRVAVFTAFTMSDTAFNVSGNPGFRYLLEYMAGDSTMRKPSRRQLSQLLPAAFAYTLSLLTKDIAVAKAVAFGNLVLLL